MSQQEKDISYIPQLDTLRTVAVLLVIISHWVGIDNIINYLPNGMMGVNLFFVLSGFLISGILLRAKNRAETTHSSKRITFINFYIRRSFRIFPIYLIVVTILYFANFDLIKTNPVYFYSYTHNFLYHAQNAWPGYISHLWSLAVEEQFYLLWPFILLFTPNKYIKTIMYLSILIGIISHFSLNMIIMPENHMNSVLLPTCLYAFGMGGLLAYYYQQKLNIIRSTISKIIFVLTIILFGLYAFTILNFQKEVIERVLFSIISMYIIHFTYNFKGLLLKIFSNPVTVYLGKMSYGLYLFHPLIAFIYKKVHAFFKLYEIKIPFTQIYFFPNIEYPLLRMIFSFILLVTISAISWHIVEKPINNFKKYFKYNK